MLLIGDALTCLRKLPSRYVSTCVTSPPYWGLRDYGTATWEGGDQTCDHRHQRGGEGTASKKQNTSAGTQTIYYRTVCQKCGARRIDRQIGIEPTPEAYVAKLVEVFREVRRVLHDEGTLWLNLGDSYANDGKWGGSTSGKHATGLHGKPIGRLKRTTGLKPKDLCGIPWRVAFALQADGWYLRNDIIWAKPNPMPSSVRDRCTTAHEYIFLFAKSSRYYFDQDAIKEPATYAGKGRGGSTNRYEQNAAGMDNKQYDTRNKRTVWTVCPKAYKGAHFATYPPDLIRPCILAGCPEGGIVLDPFAGSGTTGLVARQHNRRFVGIELNPEYRKLIQQRLREGK